MNLLIHIAKLISKNIIPIYTLLSSPDHSFCLFPPFCQVFVTFSILIKEQIFKCIMTIHISFFINCSVMSLVCYSTEMFILLLMIYI